MSSIPLKSDSGPEDAWTDVSDVLDQASAELEHGQLIQDESFSLFEAMSALEVMDPKMDAGMPAGDYQTAQEAISAGAAPLDLSIWQLIDVIDHLLSAEATWHAGQSLSQTAFSCLYLLDRPRTQPNALIHALCSAVCASCSEARVIACKAEVIEEEDFVTASFGLPLDADPDAALFALEAMEAQLEGKASGSSSKAGPTPPPGDLFLDFPSLLSDPQLLAALLARLSFRKSFLLVLRSFLGPLSDPSSVSTCRRHIGRAMAALKAVSDSSSFLAATAQTRDGVGKHGEGGKGTRREDGGGGEGKAASGTAPSSHEDSNGTPSSTSSGSSGKSPTTTASGLTPPGFCASVNRSLLAPTPPRPVTFLTWQETLASFSSLLQDLLVILSLPLSSSFARLSRFVWTIQRMRKPGPMARSCLRLFVFGGEGRFLGHDPSPFLLSSLCLPPSHRGLAEDPLLESFTKSAAWPTSSLLRALCSNPSRQRRYLTKIFPEWNKCVREAETAGASSSLLEYASTKFSEGWWRRSILMSWTIETISRCTLHFLILGFVNELYAPEEFGYVFWYMGNVLDTLLHNVTAREQSQEGLAEARKAAASAGKNRRANKKAQDNPSPIPAPSLDLVLLSAYKSICQAFVRLLVAAKADDKLPLRSTQYNREKERYVQRFEALKRLHVPEALGFASYQRSTDIGTIQVSELYEASFVMFQSASRQLKLARTLLEKQQELQQQEGRKEGDQGEGGVEVITSEERMLINSEVEQLDKVVSRNCLALQLMHRVGGGPSLVMTFDSNAHFCFPVISLKSPQRKKVVQV